MSADWNWEELAARISDPHDCAHLLVVFAFQDEYEIEHESRAAAEAYVLVDGRKHSIGEHVGGDRFGWLFLEGEDVEDAGDRIVAMVAAAVGVAVDDVIEVGAVTPPGFH